MVRRMRDDSAAGRPRVAFFPGFLGPAGGGAARSACLIAASLAARGCRVYVEGLRDAAGSDMAGPDMLRDLPLAGCDVRVHRAVSDDHGLRSTAAVARLRSIISELDVVHFNGHWNPLNHALAEICHAAGVPYVISARSSADPANMRLGGVKNLGVLQANERRYVSSAFAVHVTSSIEGRRARFEAAPQRVLTICNPVELDHLGEPPSRCAARRALGMPGQHLALLYYGRLVPQKQPDFAVRVLAQLPRRENVHLYLVGAGTDEEIKTIRGAATALSVTDQVHLMGHASGAGRAQWLAAADALLLPSLAENFSLTLVESVASGLPAVVSPNVGALEYLQPHDATVIALDTRLWADACAGLLRATAGPREKHLTRLRGLFHPERIVEDWLDVYQQHGFASATAREERKIRAHGEGHLAPDRAAG
jgi:glycosyltransferase involved in cell wall biosynthesis